MKFKTFILTFLMMMSCSILFGQGESTGLAKTESKFKQFLFNYDYGTITIGDDFSVSSTIEIPKGRKITIDLNGHKLTTNEDIYIFKNFGQLTITDNSTDGKGTISSLGIYNGKPQTRTNTDDIDYTAQLTIKGGVFENISKDGGAAIYNHLGVIDIQGGEFYGKYSAITNFGLATIANAYIECLNRDNGAAAIFNDFEIEYGNNVNVVGRYYTADSETASITDGKATYLFAELNGVKYPSLQAALDKCATGNNTINLLFHNSDNATVSQKEGVNITIDGNGYKGKQFEYTGTICVHGNSRNTGTETLTIQDINFITENDSHDFILCDFRKCNEAAETVVRYAHNVTVQNCNFNAKEESTAVVALRFRQSYNINVKDSEFKNLHSAMWATGTSGIAFDNITATKCKEGGISVATSTPVSVKNSIIEGAQYGVRADGSGNYSLNVENSTLSAEVPVIVRKTTGEYDLTVAEDVTLTATNGGPQVVVTKDSDDKPYVAPTVKVNVTLNNGASTFGLVAKIGNKYYSTLDEAFAVATEGQTITLLGNATPVLTSQRAITKAAVIDLGGKTLTLTEDDLYFGTTTFQNGNIVVDPSVKASTAVFWMFENQTLTFDNVNITATGVTGTYLIGINGGTGSAVNLLNNSSIIIDNESQAGLTAVISDNGTNNNVKIENSTIDVKNIEGRFYLGGTQGDIVVDNTDITLNGVKEGFYLRANQTLSIEGESEVEVVLNDTNNRYGINITDYSATYTKDDSATVNATVYDPVVRVKNLTELQTALVENVDKPIFATETIVISEGTLELDLNTRRVFAADKNVIKNDGATLTIKNGTIERVGDVVGYAFNNAQGTLNITGTTIKGGLYTSGTSLVATNANISHFQSTRHAIYAYDCNVTLNGGTYHNDNSGNATIMAAGSSVVTIKDGTFSIKDGRQELGWTSCLTDTQNTASITVEGGTFNGGFRVQTGTTMTIEGGSFNDCYGSNYNIYGTAVVKGGTFTDANAINFAKGNLAEGYVASDNGNGTFTVLKGVAKIGDTYYATLQEAINEVENGETITLLANCDEAVHINKTNVAFTIDGQISETEKVDFSGVIGINIGQNVTIRNIDFNGATANHDFIKNEGSPTGKNYNTTLLVENCSFTGNSEFDVVGVRTTHPTHTQIVNCTADGLHSLLQNTGGQKVTADNVVVINGKEGGLALGGVRAADVKNSKITANGYGVRIDAGTADAVFNIESSEFNAYIPVIARKATAQNVNFTFSGENTMTQTNEDNVWFVIENVNSGYHNGNVSLETLVTPTGNVSVTLNGTGLDRKGIYGSALNGEGTEDNPYLIETVNDLVFFREKVNGGNNYAGKHVKLAANIDLNNKEWTPIGNVTYDSKYKPADASKVFSGVFNGNGKVISNLKVASTVGGADTQANVGFFGITGEGADIKDLTLTNVNIETDGRNVGALAGFAYKATLSNITVNGNIQIKGGNNVSGVAGMTRFYDMSATNIKVVGNGSSAIVGNNIVGGIFAEIAPNGSVQTFNNLSVENVAINGVGGVGGIVGLLTTGTVENVSVKNVALTGRTDYQGNAMGRIRLGSVAGLMGGKYATIANEVIDNVTAKNLDGNAVVLPIIGANYDASSNATEAKIGVTYYATLETAINAVKKGDNTIQLLADVNENVTVIQKEGFNILIDGKKAENENYQFDGIINIYGNARHTGTETLTIQNIDFYTEVPNTTPYYFINALENGSVTVGNTTYNKQYAHNVTVKGCKFTTSEEDTDNQIVGIGLRQTYNIVVDNCTANHIFSLMWGTAVDGLELNEVTLENATEGITLGGASKGVEIKNSKIVSPSYGIRAEGPGHDFTITDSEIEAVVPFVVRNVAEDNNTLSFNFEGTNTIKENNPTDYWFVAGKTEYIGQTEELPTAPAGTVVVTLNDTNLSYDGVYGNFAVAKIGSVQYTSFEAALNAVEDGETITLFNITGSELSKEIEFTKDIEFTITGTAPNYALPVVTFQNATVNIKDAEILIPELDARQNAIINVIDSKVYDAGGNSIAKSYYNGAINISGTSEVYMMQVTTMGYINISGTAKLHATWQTNVYGNGLVTIKDNATFNTAALHLTGQAYSGRDNTDAERAGKPAEIVVDGANFTVGKVLSSNNADYSYNSSKGINVGTVDGKSAILNIKNGGKVNIHMANGETTNFGAGATVNVDASTLNTICRSAEGTVTLANNGTMNVTGAASINIKKLTGKAINFTDVTIADAYIGGRVNAFGTNNFSGETNVTGILSLGYETNPTEQVIVNITGKFNGTNVIVYVNNGTDNVLNVGNKEGEKTTAHFANLGAFGDVNIVNTNVTYGYAYFRNDLNVTNSTMAISGGVNTYFSGNAKVVIDNSSWNLPGYANIGSYGGPDYKGNADVTLKNGSSMTATNLGVEQYDGKTVILTLEDSSTLTATNLSNTGSIVLANDQAKITSNVFDNAPTTTVAYHKVNYVDGSYVVVAKDYVAQIYDVDNNTNDDRRYETLAEAATAAQDGETIQLLWNEGDAAISMAATFVGNKTVTITGTANVDWSNGWFFVGRGGEDDGHVIFDNAKLTSVSNSRAYGINVSGRKKGSTDTYNGTVEFKNSTVVLDYLIQKNVMTLDNSTLTVKNGCSLTGRLANETENGELATSTTTLNNRSKLVVNGQNGMDLGYEGYGVLNIDATSTFEATENYGIAANGTMNVNGGNVKVAGTLTNNGTMNVATESNVEVTGNLNVNGTLKSAGNITANIVKAETATIQLTGGIYTTEPQDSWCAESYGAVELPDGTWFVRMLAGTQTREFANAGWYWFSTYIQDMEGQDGLTTLKSELDGKGKEIKSQHGGIRYYPAYDSWTNALTSLSTSEMYMINTTDPVTVEFNGDFVEYESRTINLVEGWNWIGYPVSQELDINVALKNLQAKEGDYIKGKNDGEDAWFVEGYGWWSETGDFKFKPGHGYMYLSQQATSFTFNAVGGEDVNTDVRRSVANNYHWNADATQYPSNMTMVAVVDGIDDNEYEVAAFVNGEVRGSARPAYFEPLDTYILVLTIHGDDVEEMTFKYYDLSTNTEYDLNNKINYSNDAIVGSIYEPYMLTRGTTGIGEAAISNVNIYPNPTTTGTEINLEATCDKVEVFNALGVKVAEYQNVDTIDALETAGIYVIRITNNGNVQNCRLVVK